jgi:hypothetical protein
MLKFLKAEVDYYSHAFRPGKGLTLVRQRRLKKEVTSISQFLAESDAAASTLAVALLALSINPLPAIWILDV